MGNYDTLCQHFELHLLSTIICVRNYFHYVVYFMLQGQRIILPYDFWKCHICPTPMNFTGKYTRRGLRMHLIREHQSDLRRRRGPHGFWLDEIVKLTPAELHHQQTRLLIRFSSKAERHEIYANMHLNSTSDCISSPQAAEGDENEMLNLIPSDSLMTSSTSVNLFPAMTHSYDIRNSGCLENMPAENFDSQCNETDSSRRTISPSIRSSSPSIWEHEFSMEYLPDLQINHAVSHVNNIAVMADEVSDYVIGHSNIPLVTPVIETSRTDQISELPENSTIPPPTPFPDDVVIEDHPTTASTSGQLVNTSEDHQAEGKTEDIESVRRDIILQIIAEKNIFRHQSDQLIAARISARAPSVISVAEIERILFAINVSENMLIDRVNDLLSVAPNAGSTDHLVIAMLIQELRSRTEPHLH